MKATDRHQYLNHISAHPYHTKKSVVFSQALRLSRLCTFEKDFERHMAGMKQWFAKRDYPQDLINWEMKKVKFLYFENKYNNNEKGIPFVVTFHSLLKSLGSIPNKNYYLFQMNDEVRKVSPLRPMFSFEGLGNSVATLSRLNCTLWKERLVHVNAMVIGVRCVEAFLK